MASEKSVQILYNKIHELVSLVSELLNIQIMTDTTVLHASSMGVAPFFAENVSELQLSSLKLVTTVSNIITSFYLIYVCMYVCKILNCKLVTCRFSQGTRNTEGCFSMIFWHQSHDCQAAKEV